ncbi:hypothetical protein HDU91_005268 [Kappamyces sp. JEL0680]|nr:hypothetical protein HDU91_005268 [Kappamyces sp. JEL0680]
MTQAKKPFFSSIFQVKKDPEEKVRKKINNALAAKGMVTNNALSTLLQDLAGKECMVTTQLIERIAKTTPATTQVKRTGTWPSSLTVGLLVYGTEDMQSYVSLQSVPASLVETLDPTVQDSLTALLLELIDIYGDGQHAAKMQSLLDVCLQVTARRGASPAVTSIPAAGLVSNTSTRGAALVHSTTPNQPPAMPEVRPGMLTVQDQALEQHRTSVATTCDMFIETLNFNDGPLGNNQLARDLHQHLKQLKIDNDAWLNGAYSDATTGTCPALTPELLLECNDRLLESFKALAAMVKLDQVRVAELELVRAKKQLQEAQNEMYEERTPQPHLTIDGDRSQPDTSPIHADAIELARPMMHAVSDQGSSSDQTLQRIGRTREDKGKYVVLE